MVALSIFSLSPSFIVADRWMSKRETETESEGEREILLTAALVCSEPVPMADDDDDCTRQH